jgi:hypothetical protein
MAVQDIQELYERHIKSLPLTDKLLLLEVIARETAAEAEVTGQYSWRDIRGIVPYPLCGEDAQAWVTRTRREGDEHRERLLRRKP